MSHVLTLLAVLAFALVGPASPVLAQTESIPTGSTSAPATPIWLSGSVTYYLRDTWYKGLDGQGAAVGAGLGVDLGRRFGLEVKVSRLAPADFSSVQPLGTGAEPGRATEIRRWMHVTRDVSILTRTRGRVGTRMELAFLAGLSSQNTTVTTEVVQVETGEVKSAFRGPSNDWYLTIGLEGSLPVGPRLAVAPHILLDMYPYLDGGGADVLMRTGLALRWRL